MKLPSWLTTKRRPSEAHAVSQPVKPDSGIAVSSRSYDDPLRGSEYIKGDVDLGVYKTLARALPFVDRGLRTLARMISPFEIECDNEATQAALEQFLRTVRVNGRQQGFMAFGRPYIRQALQYGRTAGEVVIGAGAREIRDLFVIDSDRIKLILQPDGSLAVGEQDNLGQLVTYPRQDLILYSALNAEGDNPLGVSTLRAIPFVADIVLRMENAMRQKWQRHGAPSFLLNYQVSPEIEVDDATLNTMKSSIQSDWETAMRARWNNEGILDFVAATQGVFLLTAITDGQELNFEVPYRSMMEQIVSSIELAPFILGLQWATTEGLSEAQSDVISGMVRDHREEIEPDFLTVIDWVQRVLGLRGDVRLIWSEVNFADSHKAAMADYWKAKAEEQEIRRNLLAWNNGFIDQAGAAEASGYDGQQLAYPLELPREKMAGDPGQGDPMQDAGLSPEDEQLMARAGAAAEMLWTQYP